MGNRSARSSSCWNLKTRSRAARDHARKKAAKAQKRHLYEIKSDAQIKQMVMASRRRQKK